MTKLFTRLRELQDKAKEVQGHDGRDPFDKACELLDACSALIPEMEKLVRANAVMREALDHICDLTTEEMNWVAHDHALKALEKARAIADGEEIAGDE